ACRGPAPRRGTRAPSRPRRSPRPNESGSRARFRSATVLVRLLPRRTTPTESAVFAAFWRPAAYMRLLRGHAGDREVDAAGAAADLYQNLRLVHLPQRHAGGGPRREVLADGNLPARTRRPPHAVELHPAGDAGAALRTASPRRVARVEDVRAAVDVDGALVDRAARVDRHRLVRIVDDVELDTRVLRPSVDPDVRVAAAVSRFLLRELRGHRSQLVVGLGRIPLQADARQEVAGVGPRRLERGDVEGGDRSAAAVRPDCPAHARCRARLIRRAVLRTAAGQRRAAIDHPRAAAAGGAGRPGGAAAPGGAAGAGRAAAPRRAGRSR